MGLNSSRTKEITAKPMKKKNGQKNEKQVKKRIFSFFCPFFFHFEKKKLKQQKNNIKILRIWAKKGPKKWAKTAHKMVKIKKNDCHYFFWLETTQQYGTSRFHTMF